MLGRDLMRSRTRALGFAALLAIGTAVPAFAQQTTAPRGEPYPQCSKMPTNDESEQAHQKYIAGKALYDDGNYESAIVRFRDAYNRDCTKHELLVILSRAYELNKDLPEAIRALETYLARVKDAPDRATYEQRVLNMKKELAKQQAAASATPTTSTSTPPNGTSTPPPKGEVREHSTLPWLVVTLGGAALLTGVILVVAAPPIPPNCNASSGVCSKTSSKPPPALPDESPDQLQKDQDKAGQHVTLTTTGIVLIIAGIGVAAGGVAWHFLEPTGPTTGKKKPQLTPNIGPGYGGLTLGGSF
jgi:hypothetical protein